MAALKKYLPILLFLLIPLYPKFPLVGVGGTFVSVRLEDLLLAGVFVVYLISLGRRPLEKLNNPMFRAIFLYWFIGFAASFSGIFLTKTATVSLGLLHTLRRVEYMCLFLIAYNWLSGLDQLKYYLRVFLLIGVIVAVYGLGQQFLHFPVISTTNSEFSKGLALTLGAGARINSTFAGHYDLAAFCVFPLLLIISLLSLSKNRLLLLTAGGLIYWTMLLSASRITFASFFLSAAVLIVIIRKKLWLVPLVAISFLGFLLSPQLRGRYLDLITNHLLSLAPPVSAQTLTPLPAAPVTATATAESKAVDAVPDALKPPAVAEDRSFNIRLKVEWPRALRAFIKNPLFGSGYSSVGLAVDNEYLRILAETGLLGLAGFCLIILRFFLSGLPWLRHYQPNIKSAFIASSSCFLLSLLLGGLFIDVFAASKIAMMLWSIIGLAEKTKTLSA
jgi:hypothetical protein